MKMMAVSQASLPGAGFEELNKLAKRNIVINVLFLLLLYDTVCEVYK